MVLFLPEAEAERSLMLLRQSPLGEHAARIGRVVETPKGAVTRRTRFGGTRLLDLLSGEQLPRIC